MGKGFCALLSAAGLLVLISLPVFAAYTSPNVDPQDIHYYYQDISNPDEDITKGACILEVWGEIDQSDLEGGFEEKTAEEIHGMGYMTPAEALAKAENKDGGSTDHEAYYSWCDAYSYYGAKKVSAGSHTERNTMGWLFTKGRLVGKKFVPFPGPHYVDFYDKTKTCKNICGWGATVSFQILYPATIRVAWNEYGHHEYPNSRIYYTHVWDEY